MIAPDPVHLAAQAENVSSADEPYPDALGAHYDRLLAAPDDPRVDQVELREAPLEEPVTLPSGARVHADARDWHRPRW